MFTCSLLGFCFIIVNLWFIFFFIFFSFNLDFSWFYSFYLTTYFLIWKLNRGILVFRSIWIYNLLNFFTRFLQFALLVVYNLLFSLDGRIKNWFELLGEPNLLSKIYTLARPFFDPVSKCSILDKAFMTHLGLHKFTKISLLCRDWWQIHVHIFIWVEDLKFQSV